MRALALLALLLVPVASAGPEQVRLGLPTEDPATAMIVLWLDLDPLAGPQSVMFVSNEIAARVVDGPSVGKAYEALLEGLAPDTEYEYSVGASTYTFRTPAARLDADRP